MKSVPWGSRPEERSYPVGPRMSERPNQDVAMKNDTASVPSVRLSSSTHRRGCASQLDFGLSAPVPGVTRRSERPARPCSRERAQWWFRQMHQVIDEGRIVDVAGVF